MRHYWGGHYQGTSLRERDFSKDKLTGTPLRVVTKGHYRGTFHMLADSSPRDINQDTFYRDIPQDKVTQIPTGGRYWQTYQGTLLRDEFTKEPQKGRY